ncbi:aminotransferase class V-fold PLP-dependent enzyme [Singulisphaera sp. Ch08]|uniref:Aminotransferase class V-fold PLP-dependent enzyme n=1 Tax=Singulisphaera sp. Ch08 TaxID=3120278 RepID=A0AAU7CIU2_9BACT
MFNLELLGIEPIINASGAVTRLGGAPMPEAALDAYCAAARTSIPLDHLQGVACRVIAEVTGAEAGLVTSGAAAALTLGAAAILTGFDLNKMERLPHCEGFPHEFVMAREQRNGYDHAVRAAGARLVEVGFHEPVAGSGVRRVETWEYSSAFGPSTAGVLYVYGSRSRPPLVEVVEAAHDHGLSVLVDAAGELPPRANLHDLIASGADLVAFSGGKAIRGPQATGILCGRRELVGAAALQMLDMDDHFELWEPPANLIDKARLPGLPRHGIGRGMKVSKEQIVALLAALRLFTEGRYDQDLGGMQANLERVASALEASTVHCSLIVPADAQSLPTLEILLGEAELGRSAFEVCRRLRHGKPPIYVGHSLLDEGKLLINPLHLNEHRTTVLAKRLREELCR